MRKQSPKIRPENSNSVPWLQKPVEDFHHCCPAVGKSPPHVKSWLEQQNFTVEAATSKQQVEEQTTRKVTHGMIHVLP